MRSYNVNINRLVNQLVPYYLGGRNVILFLQSCLFPLKTASEKFMEWAKEKSIEASMTSQTILFENYLSKRFCKYFKDQSEMIRISDGQSNGVPFYWEHSETLEKSPLVYKENEANKNTLQLRKQNEQTAYSDISFAVICPQIDEGVIKKEELASMIAFVVNKYNLAGKKFKVLFI